MTNLYRRPETSTVNTGGSIGRPNTGGTVEAPRVNTSRSGQYLDFRESGPALEKGKDEARAFGNFVDTLLKIGGEAGATILQNEQDRKVGNLLNNPAALEVIEGDEPGPRKQLLWSFTRDSRRAVVGTRAAIAAQEAATKFALNIEGNQKLQDPVWFNNAKPEEIEAEFLAAEDEGLASKLRNLGLIDPVAAASYQVQYQASKNQRIGTVREKALKGRIENVELTSGRKFFDAISGGADAEEQRKLSGDPTADQGAYANLAVEAGQAYLDSDTITPKGRTFERAIQVGETMSSEAISLVRQDRINGINPDLDPIRAQIRRLAFLENIGDLDANKLEGSSLLDNAPEGGGSTPRERIKRQIAQLQEVLVQNGEMASDRAGKAETVKLVLDQGLITDEGSRARIEEAYEKGDIDVAFSIYEGYLRASQLGRQQTEDERQDAAEAAEGDILVESESRMRAGERYSEEEIAAAPDVTTKRMMAQHNSRLEAKQQSEREEARSEQRFKLDLVDNMQKANPISPDEIVDSATKTITAMSSQPGQLKQLGATRTEQAQTIQKGLATRSNALYRESLTQEVEANGGTTVEPKRREELKEQAIERARNEFVKGYMLPPPKPGAAKLPPDERGAVVSELQQFQKDAGQGKVSLNSFNPARIQFLKQQKGRNPTIDEALESLAKQVDGINARAASPKGGPARILLEGPGETKNRLILMQRNKRPGRLVSFNIPTQGNFTLNAQGVLVTSMNGLAKLGIKPPDLGLVPDTLAAVAPGTEEVSVTVPGPGKSAAPEEEKPKVDPVPAGVKKLVNGMAGVKPVPAPKPADVALTPGESPVLSGTGQQYLAGNQPEAVNGLWGGEDILPDPLNITPESVGLLSKLSAGGKLEPADAAVPLPQAQASAKTPIIPFNALFKNNPYSYYLATTMLRSMGRRGGVPALLPFSERGGNRDVQEYDARSLVVEKPGYGITYEREDGQGGFDYYNKSKRVPALLPGRVKDIGWEPGYGNFLVIESLDPKNGKTVDVLYGHLGDKKGAGYKVALGQEVKPGQIIGTQGSTGNVVNADSITSVDFLASAPQGSGSMAKYSRYKELRHEVGNALAKGQLLRPWRGAGETSAGSPSANWKSSPLVKSLAQFESFGGEYGAVNSGGSAGGTVAHGSKVDNRILNRTLQQVMNGEYHANGKYQFVRETLRDMVQRKLLPPGVTVNSKFTPEVQDKLFLAYLRDTGNDPERLRRRWIGLREANVPLAKLRTMLNDFWKRHM